MSGGRDWIEGGGLLSEAMPVSRGVPQGSIQGAVFLYI